MVILILAALLALAGAEAAMCVLLRRLTGHLAVLTDRLDAIECGTAQDETLDKWDKGVADVLAYEVRR